MWRMEDVVRELKEEGEILEKNENGGLGPGFRFHPTDEELVTFYLASKVFNHPAPPNSSCFLSSASAAAARSIIDIAQVDLNRCEPWELPERAKMGEKEWYFYCLRDRKYPTGLRTNRATGSGYWKATGKDRQVYSNTTTANAILTSKQAKKAGTAGTSTGVLIGMKKTLVFYQGRAPRGVKTRWVMHEYRLDGHFSSFRLSCKEEWVICRIFQKHGEKKHSPISHPSPGPLLGSLPPLLETPTTTSSTLDSVSQDHANFNFLLLNESLLKQQPLPLNFSSSSAPSNTLHSTTTIDLLPSSIQSTTASATTASITHQWVLDKIFPQIQVEYPYSHIPPLSNFDDHLATHPDPTATNGYNSEAVVAAAAVVQVVDMSEAALGRLLDPPTPTKLTAQSWPFHP